MKKIVTLAAIAALGCGLVFADEPVANVNIAEFTGNATAEWGVDLDAQKTGFKNTETLKFKINLFDAGDKSTSSDDDIWAELVLKAGNTGSWRHHLTDVDWATQTNSADAVEKDAAENGKYDINVDTAKFHIFNFFVGIQAGDTQTGEYKFDGAIRANGHWDGSVKWLTNVGPNDYVPGISAGYDDSNLNITADFRSYKNDNQYTDSYAVAAEASLKDSNELVGGLFVDLGVSYNFNGSYWTNAGGTGTKKEITYTAEGVYDKSFLSAVKTQAHLDSLTFNNAHVLGGSANAGYKLSIDDKFFVKPAVGYTTEHVWSYTPESDFYYNKSRLVGGILLGWGDAIDDNAGLYYLDHDGTKQVRPGVSVIVDVPMLSQMSATAYTNTNDERVTLKGGNAVLAVIVPSFYTKGDLVEGLKAGVYSEIAILNSEQKKSGILSDDATGEETEGTIIAGAADKNDTVAFGIAAALSYDIKADSVTVTPQAGIRFANAAYFDNEINDYSPLSKSTKMFNAGYGEMGLQSAETEGDRAGLLSGGYLNLKLGVNVNGLINNTDFYVNWASANLLNNTKYADDATMFNVKAGIITVGAKISL